MYPHHNMRGTNGEIFPIFAGLPPEQPLFVAPIDLEQGDVLLVERIGNKVVLKSIERNGLVIWKIPESPQ